MMLAIEEDGVNVIGYTPWGCIDIVSAGTGEWRSVMALSMSIRIIMAKELCNE